MTTTFALVGAEPGLGRATARRFGAAGHTAARSNTPAPGDPPHPAHRRSKTPSLSCDLIGRAGPDPRTTP